MACGTFLLALINAAYLYLERHQISFPLKPIFGGRHFSVSITLF